MYGIVTLGECPNAAPKHVIECTNMVQISPIYPATCHSGIKKATHDVDGQEQGSPTPLGKGQPVP